MIGCSSRPGPSTTRRKVAPSVLASSSPSARTASARSQDVDVERKLLPSPIPPPAFVAGNYTEPILAGSKVRILSLTIVDKFLPVLILALQLVLEMNLFWRDEAESGVVDRQISRPGWQAQVRNC